MVHRALLCGVVLWMGGVCGAGVTVEPDDFPDRTVLNTLIPGLRLSVLDGANQPLAFNVTATVDGLNYAPTGQMVFAQSNVYFWSHTRRMRMDFATPVRRVSLDFAGGRFGSEDTGTLEAYNAAGERLGSYVTAPRGPGAAETMTVSVPDDQIAYAIAYMPVSDGTFGRLDNLTYVPEPASLALLLSGGVPLLLRRRRPAPPA